MNARYSEREIEDVLHRHPDLLPEPFREWGKLTWLARQYSVPSGRIDLLGIVQFETWCSAVVVELKRGAIDAAAITQVCRYAADISFIIDVIAAKHGFLTERDRRVHKVVIGRSINYHDYLAAGGMETTVYGYSIDNDNRLSIGNFRFDSALPRWAMYKQLADDSPFDYWVKQARIEAELLWGEPES